MKRIPCNQFDLLKELADFIARRKLAETKNAPFGYLSIDNKIFDIHKGPPAHICLT